MTKVGGEGQGQKRFWPDESGSFLGGETGKETGRLSNTSIRKLLREDKYADAVLSIPKDIKDVRRGLCYDSEKGVSSSLLSFLSFLSFFSLFSFFLPSPFLFLSFAWSGFAVLALCLVGSVIAIGSWRAGAVISLRHRTLNVYEIKGTKAEFRWSSYIAPSGP